MNEPLSAAERVRRSRWASQIETTAERLHHLLLSTPIPMPREPHINHDLVAGLIELSGYNANSHPEDDAFNVNFTASGKNQRDWMREIALELHYDRDRCIDRYAQLDEDGTTPRKRKSMSSHDYAVALWSDGVSKGWISPSDTGLQSKLEADLRDANSNINSKVEGKDMDIDTALRSMGKSCFVKHFKTFSDSKLSSEDVIEILRQSDNYTETACRTRTSNGRNIIKSGNARKALLLIASSNRLSDEIVDQARKLLKTL